MVDLFFLKTFVAVAEHGSFRIAAERNFITQPAVSQHIRILEKKFDAVFFERQGKKITLTEAGRTFLPYAKGILRQYERAKDHVDETQKKHTGTIYLATIYSIGLHSLQPKLRLFLKKYPHVHLHLEYWHNNVIYERLLNRSIDFGLVAFPKKTPGLVRTIFAEEDLVLIQSADHPVFPGTAAVALKDLHHVDFIAFSQTTPTGKEIHRMLRKNAIVPRIMQEYDNIETLKSAVLLGMGCAIVPKNTVTREQKEGALQALPIKPMPLTRSLGILHPEGKVFTKSSRAFYEMMVG